MEETVLHCPECQAELTHRKHKIFHSWECPEGHGTLYPKGELEQILKALAHLGDVDIRIWGDEERYSVSKSTLMSPDGFRPLVEIRDREHPNIMVYGDTETQSLWVHSGEEEKILELIEKEAEVDSVSTYVKLAALQAAKIFDDGEPVRDWAGRMLLAMKLLGERVMRSLPYIPF
ncbi:MAG: zf-TFIIB domain-containing protein [Acidobacteria bacterium]|nr:zf-TFIIB domain-containing protein [Acidobacteriota bacterium]MCB9396301.1 zf-TFIIB domain-containing protein [Acidobacteriota bacterium]